MNNFNLFKLIIGNILNCIFFLRWNLLEKIVENWLNINKYYKKKKCEIIVSMFLPKTS